MYGTLAPTLAGIGVGIGFGVGVGSSGGRVGLGVGVGSSGGSVGLDVGVGLGSEPITRTLSKILLSSLDSLIRSTSSTQPLITKLPLIAVQVALLLGPPLLVKTTD